MSFHETSLVSQYSDLTQLKSYRAVKYKFDLEWLTVSFQLGITDVSATLH